MSESNLDRLIRNTHPGMAHWAGTGPEGTCCGLCKFYGYDAPGKKSVSGCKRYYQLTGTHGKPIPAETASCRHYQKRGS